MTIISIGCYICGYLYLEAMCQCTFVRLRNELNKIIFENIRKYYYDMGGIAA